MKTKKRVPTWVKLANEIYANAGGHPDKEHPDWKQDHISGVFFAYYLSAGNGRFGSAPIFDINPPSMYLGASQESTGRFSPGEWAESPSNRRIYLLASHPVSLGEVEEGILLYENTYGIKPVTGVVSSDGYGNFGVLLNGAYPTVK